MFPVTCKMPLACINVEMTTEPRARLLYLPPYSPDFNPIENAFSKLKALLRAKAERTIKALWDALATVLEQFSPVECANYFKAAGYEPD